MFAGIEADRQGSVGLVIRNGVDGEAVGLELNGCGLAAGGDDAGRDVLEAAVVLDVDHGGVLGALNGVEGNPDVDLAGGLKLRAVLGEGDVRRAEDLGADLGRKLRQGSLVGDAADGHFGILGQGALGRVDRDLHLLGGLIEALRGHGLRVNDLTVQKLRQTHHDHSRLRTGGSRLRTEGAVLIASKQTGGGNKPHRVRRIGRDRCFVRVGAALTYGELVAHRVHEAVEHHGQILPGDAAVGSKEAAANTVDDLLLRRPFDRAGIVLIRRNVAERRDGIIRLRTRDAGQNRHKHGAGNVLAGREGVFGRPLHVARRGNVVNRVSIPTVFTHVLEAGGLGRVAGHQDRGDEHDDGKQCREQTSCISHSSFPPWFT